MRAPHDKVGSAARCVGSCKYEAQEEEALEEGLIRTLIRG